MADDKVLGEAVIEIRAGLDKLRADLEAVKPVIQKVVEQQEQVVNNTRQSADAAGGWASKLNGVWTTWQSITGTIRESLALGEKIGNLIVVSTTHIDALIQKISKLPAVMQEAVAEAEILKNQMKLADIEQYKSVQWYQPITSSLLKIKYEQEYGPMNEDQVRADLAQWTRTRDHADALVIGATNRNIRGAISNANAASDLAAASISGGLGELNANIKRQNEQTFLRGNPRP